MRKICVFTGTRAEYGLLRSLMKEIQNEDDLYLQILASGTHLSPEFGLTYAEIERDGFNIDEKVEILLSSDSSIGVCKAMGLGLISFCEALDRLSPDIVVILGDRYEGLAMVQACLILKIPVAHIHGGESSFGAFDESIRHSITKMSHLHFTSTDEYRNRVIQLGENPERVYNVGALGVENVGKMQMLDKKDLEQQINFDLGTMFFLITFHPVTLEDSSAEEQGEELLTALTAVVNKNEHVRLLFTKGNADTGSRVINQLIDAYVAKHPGQAVAFTTMGVLRYLSAMKYAAAVVGNSSSGIIEAPSFGVPTVNIGDRQKGRTKTLSIIDCPPESSAIEKALLKSLSPVFLQSFEKMSSPYAKENTAINIKDILKREKLDNILKKEFYNIG